MRGREARERLVRCEVNETNLAFVVMQSAWEKLGRWDSQQPDLPGRTLGTEGLYVLELSHGYQRCSPVCPVPYVGEVGARVILGHAFTVVQ